MVVRIRKGQLPLPIKEKDVIRKQPYQQLWVARSLQGGVASQVLLLQQMNPRLRLTKTQSKPVRGSMNIKPQTGRRNYAKGGAVKGYDEGGSVEPATNNGLLGYKVRPSLFPGEQSYFQANPHVAGMAAETGDVILNPHSPSDVNKQAVARNEAARLHMRERGITPSFPITQQQQDSFKGSAYESDPGALRETIVGRIHSGDPSAKATPEQTDWVKRMLPRNR